MILALLLAMSFPPGEAEPVVPRLVLAQRQPAPRPKPPEDWELLPKEKEPDAATLARERERERQLAKRRTMLQLHQIGGYLTVASLGATVVLGQLDYVDKYGGGGDVGTYRAWHRWVAITSAAIFAGTASLALFAPTPIERQTRLDSATVHKIAMTVAAAGMATQIVLGIITASKEGSTAQRDFALAHQIVGYTTLAASLTGFTVLAF